jgi:hypothetical protein
VSANLLMGIRFVVILPIADLKLFWGELGSTCWPFRWPAHKSKQVAATEENPMFNRETESRSGFLPNGSTSVAKHQDAGSSSPRPHRNHVLSSV